MVLRVAWHGNTATHQRQKIHPWHGNNHTGMVGSNKNWFRRTCPQIRHTQRLGLFLSAGSHAWVPVLPALGLGWARKVGLWVMLTALQVLPTRLPGCGWVWGHGCLHHKGQNNRPDPIQTNWGQSPCIKPQGVLPGKWWGRGMSRLANCWHKWAGLPASGEVTGKAGCLCNHQFPVVLTTGKVTTPSWEGLSQSVMGQPSTQGAGNSMVG